MDVPRVCPHCGTESIEPTFLYATLSVSFDQINCTIPGLQAYRCDNAHFFMIFGNQKDAAESAGESQGPRTFM